MLELDKHYKYASILSGGNRRKLCTALTLLTSPKLAYFDEPTVGLDPVARRNLLNLIKVCGASVLITTHRLDEAEYLCTRVAIIQKGVLLYDGKIEEIMKNHFEKMKGEGGFTGLLSVKCSSSQNLLDRFSYLSLDSSEDESQVFKIMGVIPLS